ncbi:MAG: ABC transporter ATP-binding protein [Elusimicrobiota bacterium]
MNNKKLIIKNLSMKYKDKYAVRNLSLEVEKGEIYGFLGPNRAGKTTTINISSGLMLPTEGDVIICGKSIIDNPKQAKKKLALVPDHPDLYPYMSPVDYISFLVSIYDLKPEPTFRRAEEYFREFEIYDARMKIIDSFSLGMKQKLLFISAFVRKPEVIIIDEPMVGVDPLSAQKLKKEIKKLASQGTAIFMSTHILDIATQLCDRISIINKGKIVNTGTLEELRKKANLGDSNLESIFIKLTSERDK